MKDLCILCETHGKPPEGFWPIDHPNIWMVEENRCEVCNAWDCCAPNSDAEICPGCGESYCPHCGRWEPNCQRGI